MGSLVESPGNPFVVDGCLKRFFFIYLSSFFVYLHILLTPLMSIIKSPHSAQCYSHLFWHPYLIVGGSRDVVLPESIIFITIIFLPCGWFQGSYSPRIHHLYRHNHSEMGKAADPADISVLFFPAGANFWHICTRHEQYDAGTNAISTGHWWF